GTKLGPKREEAGREEIGDRRLRLLQSADMGDIARRLDGEDEILRRLRRPPLETLGLLQGIEGAIDLNRGKSLGRIGELILLRQVFGIEDAAPGAVGPARNADAHDSSLRSLAPRTRLGSLLFVHALHQALKAA